MKTMFGRVLPGGLPVGGLAKSSTGQRHSKPTSKQIQIERPENDLLKKR